MRRTSHLGRTAATLGLTAGALLFAAAPGDAASGAAPAGSRPDAAPGRYAAPPDRHGTTHARPAEGITAAAVIPSASGPGGSAAPAPAQGPGGAPARTGAGGERLWLLGGLALALAATAVVARAAWRGRADH
ncbi:hypothetical protein [Streptomyces sp. NBC_01216]|uniref:hypothetical protein n=1 Tax=unclassified Streptomyces TaxID=2593676 RepID=UPI002E120749|nr:hypothetical protein OG393_13505 [Streptomyces sp. NBC_01216]